MCMLSCVCLQPESAAAPVNHWDISQQLWLHSCMAYYTSTKQTCIHALIYHDVTFLRVVKIEKFPTYQELISLLNDAESVIDGVLSTAELVVEEFRLRYPHIYIGRPRRFLETIKRISGPIVNQKLNESSEKSYLKRQWKPRIRNVTTKDQGTVSSLCL